MNINDITDRISAANKSYLSASDNLQVALLQVATESDYPSVRSVIQQYLKEAGTLQEQLREMLAQVIRTRSKRSQGAVVQQTLVAARAARNL